MARDKASLDILWLKDDSPADSENPPPPKVAAKQSVEDLKAALEQFRSTAGDLNGGPAVAGADREAMRVEAADSPAC